VRTFLLLIVIVPSSFATAPELASKNLAVTSGAVARV